MVNVKKQKQIKKKGSVTKLKSAFNNWLRNLFGTSNKLSYFYYWGGINGAINRKYNNWNPDNEGWIERNGLLYSSSNKEIKLPYSIFTSASPEEMHKVLWEGTETFLSDPDIDLSYDMIDVSNYFHNKFDIFKFIDEAKKYELLFLKNMTLELWMFLVDFGISECVNYIFVFFTEEESNRITEIKMKDGMEDVSGLLWKVKPKFLKEGKVGFELYDNLTEWKKEINAPTRNDPEYRQMVKRVRDRDDFTCQCCGYRNTNKVKHNLQVHHIFGYKDHLDYRTEDNNCITLCTDCHKGYHSIYGRDDVNPIKFIKFMREYNTYPIKSVQSTLDSQF